MKILTVEIPCCKLFNHGDLESDNCLLPARQARGFPWAEPTSRVKT